MSIKMPDRGHIACRDATPPIDKRITSTAMESKRRRASAERAHQAPPTTQAIHTARPRFLTKMKLRVLRPIQIPGLISGSLGRIGSGARKGRRDRRVPGGGGSRRGGRRRRGWGICREAGMRVEADLTEEWNE
jgi:hypothetical protein